jgi:hypothetical protein
LKPVNSGSRFPLNIIRGLSSFHFVFGFRIYILWHFEIYKTINRNSFLTNTNKVLQIFTKVQN